MPWVQDPHSGGTKIPEGLKARIKRRILAHAEKHYAAEKPEIRAARIELPDHDGADVGSVERRVCCRVILDAAVDARGAFLFALEVTSRALPHPRTDRVAAGSPSRPFRRTWRASWGSLCPYGRPHDGERIADRVEPVTIAAGAFGGSFPASLRTDEFLVTCSVEVTLAIALNLDPQPRLHRRAPGSNCRCGRRGKRPRWGG